MTSSVYNRTVWIASLAFISVCALGTAMEFPWISLLPAGLLMVYLALFAMDKLLLVVAFATPLSIPLSDDLFGIGMFFPTEPLMFGIMVLFLLRLMHEGKFDPRFIRHPLSVVIILQLGWILITSLLSSMPVISLKFFISRLWFVSSFYFLASQMFRQEKNIYNYLWMYIIGLSIVIGYTLFAHAQLGFAKDPAHWVMSPFYKDHTSYGAMIAFYFPVLIALTFKGTGTKQLQWLKVLLLIVFSAALVLSYTRAAWLSLVGALGVLFLIRFRIPFKVVLGIGLTIAVMIIASWGQIIMQLERNDQDSSEDFGEHIQSMSNISTDASNLERLNRWNSALRMFKERPLVGWGPGTYQFQYAPFQHPDEKTIISTNNADGGNAHSEYLGPLAEQGFLGPIWMFLIIIYALSRAIPTYYRIQNGQLKAVYLAVILGLVTYFLHGVLNNFLDTDKASVAFWGFLAILVIVERYHLDEKEKSSQATLE
jgi:O-antigen ligase